jgi:hypothetical protein
MTAELLKPASISVLVKTPDKLNPKAAHHAITSGESLLLNKRMNATKMVAARIKIGEKSIVFLLACLGV